MIGWMIIFAIGTTTSGVWGSAGQAPDALLVSGLFGILFLLGLGARAVRSSDY